jgi:hypothetical protein
MRSPGTFASRLLAVGGCKGKSPLALKASRSTALEIECLNSQNLARTLAPGCSIRYRARPRPLNFSNWVSF